MRLVDALEIPRKQCIKEQNTNLNGLSLYDFHLIKKNQAFFLVKLNSKELYNILTLGNYKKPASQGSLTLSLNTQLLIGKIFICYQVRLLLTQNIAYFNAKL